MWSLDNGKLWIYSTNRKRFLSRVISVGVYMFQFSDGSSDAWDCAYAMSWEREILISFENY